MDGKQGNEQEQKQPFPPQQGGEGRPICQSLGDDQIRPESGREEEIEEGNNVSNKVLEIESQEYATGRSAQIVQKEESNDKNAQNVESTSQKDTKTKVRDVARNRRRKARERNEKKQAEIARLTKLNVQLIEKNQALINELIMLGVDTNTIQLFLNCLQVNSTTNQELITSPVPSPQYKFSL